MLYFLFSQLENLKEKIDEENQKKSDALKGLSKATAEMQLWRSKYETEGLGHVEELEAVQAANEALKVRIEELEASTEKEDKVKQHISF